MKLTGCVGIREGFRFQYQNLVGEGRVTEEALQALQPAMEQAVKRYGRYAAKVFPKRIFPRTGRRNMFIFRVRRILRKGTRTTKLR